MGVAAARTACPSTSRASSMSTTGRGWPRRGSTRSRRASRSTRRSGSCGRTGPAAGTSSGACRLSTGRAPSVAGSGRRPTSTRPSARPTEAAWSQPPRSGWTSPSTPTGRCAPRAPSPVPDLADVCVIDLLAEDGTTTRAAIVVGDPRYQAIADALMDYPSIPGTGGLMGSVFASGRSTLVEDVTDDTLLARTKDRRHADILRDLGIRSAIAVPLAARGQVLGAMALIHGWSGRRYRADDVPSRRGASAPRRARPRQRPAVRGGAGLPAGGGRERDREPASPAAGGRARGGDVLGGGGGTGPREARPRSTRPRAASPARCRARRPGVVVADGRCPPPSSRVPAPSRSRRRPLAVAAQHRRGQVVAAGPRRVRARSPKVARALAPGDHRARSSDPPSGLRTQISQGRSGLSFPEGARAFPAAEVGLRCWPWGARGQGIARAILGAARRS